jgi:hypothetical protein
VYPKAALLDCVNKSVVLDASKSTTLPGALSTGKNSTGIRTYRWSNGASTPKITVSQSGTYAVTVSYTYKWLSPTGFVTRTIAKSATALVIGSINNKPVTPLPLASKNVACTTDTILYYQPSIAGASYSWTVTNGKVLGKTTSDSVKIAWNGNSPKKLCVRLSAACGAGNDT